MRARLLLALALCLGAGPGLAADEASDERNVYAAGATVEVTQPVRGDLLAAGGRVRVDQPVRQDAALAGGDVLLLASVGQDLRAAGGQISIESRIGGDAHLAGGSVRLERIGEIAGRSWIAGGDVQLLGKLGQPAKIYAGKLTIAGEIDGDVQASAETIALLPGAVVKGRLRYASPNEIRVATGASVAGGIEREPLTSAGRPMHESTRFGIALWLASLLAAGVAWRLLFPRFAQGAQSQLESEPGLSLAVGAGVSIGVPVAVALLIITIIGAPLALVLLAAYGLVLLAGYLVVAGTLADRLLAAAIKRPVTAGWRIGALALALLLLLLIGAIPIVGWVLVLAALMAGSGALVRHRFGRPPSELAWPGNFADAKEP